MPSQTDDGEVTDGEADRPNVTTHESVKDRTVFTEDGNQEGWIATDLTVDLRR
ncbi:hypothetical protein EGH21_09635 [Halomicroarcula sp. F13]|uniref:Uncharacterized protein n=1 Tax=Haloarcula rubra TaxID=2487747 RepID=A0AAW4PPZ4_9EURY|nr:hypothetical protein [Halomicroarcula rubra]MBX0323291.1 hypothetical protein [Halomicroarcula rubra]